MGAAALSSSKKKRIVSLGELQSGERRHRASSPHRRLRPARTPSKPHRRRSRRTNRHHRSLSSSTTLRENSREIGPISFLETNRVERRTVGAARASIGLSHRVETADLLQCGVSSRTFSRVSGFPSFFQARSLRLRSSLLLETGSCP
jgi:hypothetical protein